ncbi:unnamed protein product [Heligmosomoides polygyrus]|uniref:MFS domain-containing protein n=1 Tax=Heligmosomoides polygyrus TaxID=6339 RepID=A0A3P7WFX3_HELPZ|nr:unnamed protein product [Heligmosomoides polygyrus]
MMMEYTNNKYRVVMASAFQWPFAYMTIALIAYLTKGWQNFFVFLNLVSSPLTIAFMLFLESPRWLIATGQLDKACEVLNDIAHRRWNNTKAHFNTEDISSIHKNEKKRFYTFYHLFSTPRLAKQSLMQILSMFTYAMVSNTYIYTVGGMHDSVIMFIFLDGIFRLFTPFVIIFLDMQMPSFGRKIQFVGALLIEGVLFGVIIALIQLGYNYDHIVFNERQQRRQCVPLFRHIGSIVGLVVLTPLLSSWTVGAFVVPECMIIITLIAGFFLQPETKGKALMDQMVQANYGRLENELPRALIRQANVLAAGHKVAQMEARERYRKELEAVQAAKRAGQNVDSPWAFKESSPNAIQTDGHEYRGSKKEREEEQLNQYSNDAFDRDNDDKETDLGIPSSF